MTAPTCAHCNSTTFELQDSPNIQGANFIYSIVRCSDCGAPIGVLEDDNISATLAEHAIKLDELGDLVVGLKNHLAKMDLQLSAIFALVQQIYNNPKK
jgi:hypothetical protein